MFKSNINFDIFYSICLKFWFYEIFGNWKKKFRAITNAIKEVNEKNKWNQKKKMFMKKFIENFEKLGKKQEINLHHLQSECFEIAQRFPLC